MRLNRQVRWRKIACAVVKAKISHKADGSGNMMWLNKVGIRKPIRSAMISEDEKGGAMRTRLIRKTKEVGKIGEAIGKERGRDFWAGKTPCWEMCHCPQMIREECPVSKYAFLPCWEIEGTYCKLDDYGATGRDTTICELCRVYKRWGQGKPIELKLLGRGIDTSLGAVQRLVAKEAAGK